jgi:hypothetical protein
VNADPSLERHSAGIEKSEALDKLEKSAWADPQVSPIYVLDSYIILNQYLTAPKFECIIHIKN